MSTLTLKPGREKSLLRRHPWIFSGAVAGVDGDPAPGASVEVVSSRGEFLARAAYSPASQIRARAWTFDPHEAVDETFIRNRIFSAIQQRLTIFGVQSAIGRDLSTADRHSAFRLLPAAFRLVYAESDSLPGLIVDRYADTLVLQSLTAGSEFWKETIAGLLLEATGLSSIFERSDADVRALEGLPAVTGPLRGQPGESALIAENGMRFKVDIAAGHKTGFYLDQRDNRQRVRCLAKERDVLDCFCYTGGFSLNALAGGARSVLSVDSSAGALEMCRENTALNELPADRHSTLEGDVFQLLRKFRDQGRTFDLVVLDPPKFAPTAAQAEKAARGYKDINLMGFKLLRPGGLLATFSCSGGVDAGLFQKIVASAALDAGCEAQILEHLTQSADHPVALNFPEGAYLKGLICRRT